MHYFVKVRERSNTFIFCTVVMIVVFDVYSPKGNFTVRLSLGDRGSHRHRLLSLHRHPHSLFLAGPLSFSSPHNLSCDRPVSSPQSNSSEDPFLISISTCESLCVEARLGSAKLSRIIRSVRSIYKAMHLMIGCYNSSTSSTLTSSRTMAA